MVNEWIATLEEAFNFPDESLTKIFHRLYFITEKIVQKRVMLCTLHVFRSRGSMRITFNLPFHLLCVFFSLQHMSLRVYIIIVIRNIFTPSDREITFPCSLLWTCMPAGRFFSYAVLSVCFVSDTTSRVITYKQLQTCVRLWVHLPLILFARWK